MVFDLDGAGRVFPARAGMIPPCWAVRFGGCGIPRESGDDPAVMMLRDGVDPYSPRERG